MRRVAVLLRAVNVGGTGVLPMAKLTAWLVGLGYADARTLLASGNAVLSTDEPAAKLEKRLERESVAGLDGALTVLVRDAADLDALIAADPFPDSTREHPSQVLAMFGREPVDPALLDALEASHEGPERVVQIGRELVIDFAGGMGRSTLDRSMRKLKFPAIATGRNWNTVLKLRGLL